MTLPALASMRHGTSRGIPIVALAPLGDAEYRVADAFLRAAGGRWDRKLGGHAFAAGTDTAKAVEDALRKGYHRDANPTDFFPTPPSLADRLVDVGLDRHLEWALGEHGDRGMSALEPSAGHGALIEALRRRLPRAQVAVTAFEVDPRNAAVLAGKGIEHRQEDFLLAPVGNKVDLALMNPPFAIPGHKRGWIQHVMRALAWVRPGGSLAAVIPDGDPCACGPDGIEALALANARGSLERQGIENFEPSDRGTRGARVGVAILHVGVPEEADWMDNPRGGYPNYYHWATAAVIANNDAALLEAARRPPAGGGRPGVPEVSRRLEDQRAAWVRLGAPWVSGKVSSRELAEGVLEQVADLEWPGGPEPGAAARNLATQREATQGTLGL